MSEDRSVRGPQSTPQQPGVSEDRSVRGPQSTPQQAGVSERLSYEQRRPWTVPDSLDDLRGPTGGVVELPNHLDWSEQRRYDLDDPAQLGLMYEVVIRESMTADDLARYLHGPTLRAVWRRLYLPRTVRALWESRFASLRTAA